MTWLTAARAALNAVGAYFFVTAVVLTVLGPFRYSLPRYGTISYPPELALYALGAAAGVAVGAAVAYARGGIRALAIVGLLQAAVAASGVVPIVQQGDGWASLAPPRDLVGLTTFAALVLSELLALVALAFGLAIGVRFLRRRTGPAAALEAAGAYCLAAVALVLPTPVLDLRSVPFQGSFTSSEWLAIGSFVPAVAAGIVLASRQRPLWRTAAIAAAIGLAATAPIGIQMLTNIGGPVAPVLLLVGPLASAGVAVALTLMRPWTARRLSALERLSLRSRLAAAAVGGAVAATALIGAASALADMPTGYDFLAPLEGTYRRTGDARKVVVTATIGHGVDIRRVWVQEEPGGVTVSVRARKQPSWYASDLVGIAVPIVVTLRDPLGERMVIEPRWGARLLDQAVLAQQEVGVIEGASVRATATTIDFRWTDSQGTHSVGELGGQTVVLLNRDGRSVEAKMSIGAVESYIAKASSADRARVRVLVIHFDRRLASPSRDEVVRTLVISPGQVPSDAPAILREAGVPALWVIGPDGTVRDRIVGRAASDADVASLLGPAR